MFWCSAELLLGKRSEIFLLYDFGFYIEFEFCIARVWTSSSLITFYHCFLSWPCKMTDIRILLSAHFLLNSNRIKLSYIVIAMTVQSVTSANGGEVRIHGGQDGMGVVVHEVVTHDAEHGAGAGACSANL